MFEARVKGRDLDQLIMLEIFCGKGGLCASLRKEGLRQSVGLDAHVSKTVHCPVVRIDLSTEWGQQQLFRALDNPRVIYCHLSPPCGTSSRAREVCRRNCAKGSNSGHAAPLRSVLEPDGLSTLSGTGLKRVALASALYALTSKVARYCHEQWNLVLR